MITLEQIQQLESRVHAAVEKIQTLTSENATLKERLGSYESRIGELEELIAAFKSDQDEIEAGIVSALSHLDELEDAVATDDGTVAAEPKATEETADASQSSDTDEDSGTSAESQGDEPDAEADTGPSSESSGEPDDELDIFESMRIELLGASFSIQTDEDPAYLAKVVDLYRQKVSEIQGSVSTQDNLKVAILAGILTADAYMKKSGEEGAPAEVGLITAKLITELDEALGEEDESGAPAEQVDAPPSGLDF